MATAQYAPGREAVQVTASPNILTERAKYDPNAGLGQLLSSLGSPAVQNTLDKFNASTDADKQREQAVKFDWYVEQFAKDQSTGAVTQAQVRERFPETVPIIAARIAEGVGKKRGLDQFSAVIEEINGNDSLRLDTTQRAAFIKEKRDELLKDIGPEGDFFGAGMVAAIDGSIRQNEQTWQSQTAAYHQALQVDSFSTEVSALLNAGTPESLLALDEKYGKSSSLNVMERKKAVVKTAIDLAFTNDDQEILKNIPPLFLNAEYKADLDRARVQLQDRRMSNWRFSQAYNESQRSEAERVGKAEIIEAHAAGTPIDPAKYRNDPSLYKFAIEQREVGNNTEAASVARSMEVENQIWNEATAGKSKTLEEQRDSILNDKGINPKQKDDILKRLDKIREGASVMEDPLVRRSLQDRIGPALQNLQSSSAYNLLRLSGRNVQAEVVKSFDLDLRRSWQAEYEATGKFPIGHQKLELIDKAVDRAEAKILAAMDIKAAAEGVKKPSKPNPASAKAGPTTTAPAETDPSKRKGWSPAN